MKKENSLVSGDFNSPIQENHVFISEDKELVDLGISYLTRKCYTLAKMAPSILAKATNINTAIFNNPGDLVRGFWGAINGDYYAPGPVVYSFEKFDRNTKKYISDNTSITNPSALDDLIKYHEQMQTIPEEDIPSKRNANYDRKIIDIKNSLGGCVKVQFPKSALFTGGSSDDFFTYKVYLYDRKRRDNRRTMSYAGAPMVTDVPRRASGAKYAFKKTLSHQTNSYSNIGSYLNPDEGGLNNPNNAITAPIRLAYNTTDCVFEAANQILVRLLTDVDAAPLTSDVPPDNFNVTSNSDFYDIDGAYYMGQFTTGLAIPLCIENGNPHMFGPNIIECQEKKLEKIRVVNRSLKSYKVGEQALANNINGEWVLASLGEGEELDGASSVRDWAFTKMIANSDAFFKDDNFIAGEPHTRIISPSTYETAARHRFYADNSYKNYYGSSQIFNQYYQDDEAALIPIYNVDTRKNININGVMTANRNYVQFQTFTPSLNYIVTTAFDFMNKRHGGFVADDVRRTDKPPTDLAPKGKLIDYVNVFDENLNNGGDGTMADIFPFWGPVLTDGYVRLSNEVSEELKIPFFEEKYFTKYEVDLTEFGTKNVPAEITSRIMNMAYDMGKYVYLNSHNRNDARNTFFYPPMYSSEPVNQSHVHFVPLTDTLVGHTDLYTPYTQNYGFDRKFLEQVYGIPQIGEDVYDGLITGLNDGRNILGSLHGNIVKRNHELVSDNLNKQQLYSLYILLRNLKHPKTNLPCAISAYGGVIEFFNLPNVGDRPVEFPFIPYDCYIEREPTNIPLGAPRYFRDSPQDGANCVGIIAGVCTLRKSRGGEINLEIKQAVGLQKEPNSTLTVVDAIIAVGAVMLGGTYSGGINYGIPQWGSSDDGISSFGTTALHIRIFDHWPSRDTLYDPRYFAILHFNPTGFSGPATFENEAEFKKFIDSVTERTPNSRYGVPPKKIFKGLNDLEIKEKYLKNDNEEGFNSIPCAPYGQNIKGAIPYSDRPRFVEALETNVDFRVPTIDTVSSVQFLESIDKNDAGTLVKPGTQIHWNTIFRPENEWRVNVVRRGQLLTGGGFIYPKTVIGLNPDDYRINSPGTGFSVNNTIDCGRGVIVKVKSVDNDGGITEISFDSEHPISKLKALGVVQKNLGVDFKPTDFLQTEINEDDEKLPVAYKLEIPNPGQGLPALVNFKSGLAYIQWVIDEGPKEQVPLTRVSVGSNQGQQKSVKELYKQQNVVLSLDKNDSGLYDLFTFFHNDITHTPGTSRAYSGSFLQYIDLKIT